MKYAKETYSGQALLKRYTLDTVGIWDIYGEDPNCDMGGHHHSPFLGRVSGRLEDVLAYAEQLPGFWQWGAGGEIKPFKDISIKEIPLGFGEISAKKQRDEKAAKLLAEMAKLQEQLDNLE